MKLQNVQAWRTNYKLKSASSVCTILPQTLHESGISVETICIQVIQRRNVHATVDHGTYSMCNIRGWDCSVLSTSNRLAHRGVTYASSPLEFHGPPGQKMIYSHSGLSISMRIYWRVNFLLLCTPKNGAFHWKVKKTSRIDGIDIYFWIVKIRTTTPPKSQAPKTPLYLPLQRCNFWGVPSGVIKHGKTGNPP